LVAPDRLKKSAPGDACVSAELLLLGVGLVDPAAMKQERAGEKSIAEHSEGVSWNDQEATFQ